MSDSVRKPAPYSQAEKEAVFAAELFDAEGKKVWRSSVCQDDEVEELILLTRTQWNDILRALESAQKDAKELARIAELEAQLAEARELLTEIRDNEVNAQDEADKYLRNHDKSELSKVRVALEAAQKDAKEQYAAGQRDERKLTQEACSEVAAQYPTAAFPENGTSLDCKSARMARLTVKNIKAAIRARGEKP